MKTKIIPFDLDMAEKIFSGEIEGKIKTRNGSDIRIICLDRKSIFPIVALKGIPEDIIEYNAGGRFHKVGECGLDLVLEVPDDEPKFKPFDRVLVRDNDMQAWQIALFSNIEGRNFSYITNNGYAYEQCIPYVGNEDLVGTINKPKED